MQARKPQAIPPTLATLKPHLLGLRHVGYVVDDIDRAIADFRRVYGLGDEDIQRLPDQGEDTLARFAFVRFAGTEFELIEPVSAAQKQRLLGAPSGGGGINHVAWSVRDLDGALAGLAEQGIRPGWVTPGGPAELPDKRLVYLDPAGTGGQLIELVEDHAVA